MAAKAHVIQIESNDSEANEYRVSRDEWRKWSVSQRRLFNLIYSAMIRQPRFYQHPESPDVDPEHWKTTAWNAAWEAAHALKDL